MKRGLKDEYHITLSYPGYHKSRWKEDWKILTATNSTLCPSASLDEKRIESSFLLESGDPGASWVSMKRGLKGDKLMHLVVLWPLWSSSRWKEDWKTFMGLTSFEKLFFVSMKRGLKAIPPEVIQNRRNFKSRWKEDWKAIVKTARSSLDMFSLDEKRIERASANLGPGCRVVLSRWKEDWKFYSDKSS